MRVKTIISVMMGLLFMLPLCVFSQTRVLTGTVSNSRGEPIPLASVQIKGTSIGTTASEKGEFSINISGDNQVLIISATGYASQEVRIGNSDSY
ncbi:MAG TPA: carboxypeptidase-like regulatory domain-containing protein, partial [Chitinophagaceae bacterium]|nr:carboxypeptidase-like regulatory domain-containing protein [Chitinophagaceae bacterium]